MNYDIDKYLKERDRLNKSLKSKHEAIIFQSLWILAFVSLGHFFGWGLIFAAPAIFAFVSWMYYDGEAHKALQKKHNLPDELWFNT